MPYAQINLAIDVFLIAILSFSLLPRYPKFTILLFALYLLPWIFPLTSKSTKAIPQPVKIEEARKQNPATGKTPAFDLNSGVQIFEAKDSPQEKLSKTQDLYRQILQIMGTATGTSPVTGEKTLDRQNFNVFQPSSTAEASTKLGSALTDLRVNPDAAWFYLRLFWLSAAFFLWIQNYFIGILALVPNLVPIFYLARALPLAYVELKKQSWMQKASVIVSDDQAGQTWLAKYSILLATAIIALSTFLIILLIWRQVRGVLGNRLKKFLQPGRYQVRFNGHVFDFQREGKDLIIEGLHFKANRMVQDRKRPAVWRLGSGTELEFIPREEALRKL